MANISILKIKSEKEELLVSRMATQEIMPIIKNEIYRNLDFEHIPGNKKTKLRCVITTSDTPNLKLLLPDKLFMIYSIIKFREDGRHIPQIEYVEDSVEQHGEYITFRPILQMLLTNFHCKENDSCAKQPIWTFDFEEK
ncbi:MAG: hypothetical protein LBT03_02615 [Holosporales bacterium]|jgi:hypothetical protein|nr:hypothetical protein [Holosporales bacterium]